MNIEDLNRLNYLISRKKRSIKQQRKELEELEKMKDEKISELCLEFAKSKLEEVRNGKK